MNVVVIMIVRQTLSVTIVSEHMNVFAMMDIKKMDIFVVSINILSLFLPSTSIFNSMHLIINFLCFTDSTVLVGESFYGRVHFCVVFFRMNIIYRISAEDIDECTDPPQKCTAQGQSCANYPATYNCYCINPEQELIDGQCIGMF